MSHHQWSASGIAIMILTGAQIATEIAEGRITIDPFRPSSIQPNGYDFHLGAKLIRYTNTIINVPNDNDSLEEIIIDDAGFLLEPGELYLGITEEVTATYDCAQLLYGDKSIGSLGIWVQISAPLAHVGSSIRWTLEIRVVKPTRIYAGMKFGKICFLKNHGKIEPYGSKSFWNSGRYLVNDVTPSLIDEDLPLEDS